jgi:glycogen synthase
VKMKVLNILYQAYPYVSGSTVRFHDLNSGYQCNTDGTDGINVYNVVLPFYNFEDYKIFKQDNLSYQFLTGPKNSASIYFNTLIKLIYFPILFFQMIYVVRKISPDLVDVHAMTYSLPGVILGRLFLRKKFKIVYNCRSVWHINIDSRLPKILQRCIFKLDRSIMKYVDGIIYISEDVRQHYDIKNVKSIILGNRASGTPLKPKKGTLSFGYVGSILENEGIHVAIEAFKNYRARGGIGEFQIWGSGYYEETLVSKYKNVEGVYFRGGFLPWQRKEIYSEISHIINFRLDTELSQTVTPIKSLECIMHGRQLIASNVDGIRNSIPKELYQFVTFVEAENVDSLTDAMLACDTRNSGKSENISFPNIEKYNWSNNQQKQFDYYRTLIA